jgi:hypothetical protein
MERAYTECTEKSHELHRTNKIDIYELEYLAITVLKVLSRFRGSSFETSEIFLPITLRLVFSSEVRDSSPLTELPGPPGGLAGAGGVTFFQIFLFI